MSVSPTTTSSPSSVGSYTNDDVRAQTTWQAEVSKLQVSQLDDLLRGHKYFTEALFHTMCFDPFLKQLLGPSLVA